MRDYEPHVVPGLLQAEDHARDVLRLNRPHPTPEKPARHVALRRGVRRCSPGGIRRRPGCGRTRTRLRWCGWAKNGVPPSRRRTR
ncbi:Scr1 family TA system antitoxin-like transcriptional regulator [Streptomyces sp. GD-15H]